MDNNLDIDNMLKKIIYEENIDIYNPGYYKPIDMAKQLLNQLIDSISTENGYIAIRGAGEHTRELLRDLDDFNKTKIGLIIDADKPIGTNKKFGYPIIGKDELDNKLSEISVIIISSFGNRIKLASQLYNKKSDIKIVDLYTYFELNGLYFTRPYYIREALIEPAYIYNTRCAMERSKSEEEKEIFLSRLIFGCICIRDFINTKKYINQYINSKYKRFENYKNFLVKLEKLFELIQNAMAERRQKDIIFQWVDSMGYNVREKVPYLANKKENTIFFENAFTVMPWTHFTLYTLFSGKKVIEDSLHKLKKPGEKEGEYPLWDFFVKKGYDMHIIGYVNEYVSENSNKYENRRGIGLCNSREPITYVQWQGIKSIISSEAPIFLIMHNINELHDPHVSCELDYLEFCHINFKTAYEQYGENYQNALEKNYKYVNKQLEWYSKFFSSKSTKIYFSDHGKHENHHWVDSRVHTFLAVEDEAISPQVCKKLFSYLNFDKLINYIFNPTKENYSLMFSEYIDLQCLDYYAEKAVNNMLVNQEYREFEQWMQYIGIRSDTDKYIKYVNGKEFYFVLPNEITNLIDDNKYAEKVEFYRNMISNKFIDVFQDDKFILTRKLYKGIGLKEIKK